ncbi:MAG: class I SAM-dependent methyltransferase [Pirellulaceae bacterium]|nr:class I SAM-dependent methyltransferase [Pirellulaceae bacterium]
MAEPAIASEYDAFHGDHPLMRLDVQLIQDKILASVIDPLGQSADQPSTQLLADFGCGTARIARQLEARGLRTLNIDLSPHMLQTAAAGLRPTQNSLVHSNLVELDWLADSVVDIAVCLFSSIGMIRGRQHRIDFLKHVHRTLKPQGKFLLHVHNRGHSWLDPQGPGWLISTFVKACLYSHWQFGDRVYVYRGLPSMYLHIYSRRELVADMHAAGFTNFSILPINVTGTALLDPQTWFQYFRSGGFFVLATR